MPDEVWDELEPCCVELARAARKDAAGCAAFSSRDGSDGLRFDAWELPAAEELALLLGTAKEDERVAAFGSGESYEAAWEE